MFEKVSRLLKYDSNFIFVHKHIYVTGFGKTGLIAGLVKIDFFPEKASTKFKVCLRKI